MRPFPEIAYFPEMGEYAYVLRPDEYIKDFEWVPAPSYLTTQPMTAKTPSTRPQGRPPVPEAERLRIGTIRLTQAQWDKLAALGGVEWLRKKIDSSKLK